MNFDKIVSKKVLIFLFGLVLIFGVTVYAYGSSNPNYLGHTVSEIDGICHTDGTDCPFYLISGSINDERFFIGTDNKICWGGEHNPTPVVSYSGCTSGYDSFSLSVVDEFCNDHCVNHVAGDYSGGASLHRYNPVYCQQNVQSPSLIGFECECFGDYYNCI